MLVPPTPPPPAPTTPPSGKARAATTPRTGQGARTRGKPIRILVVGEVGDGKSTLIDGLRDPEHSEKPSSGKGGRGITKEIKEYVGKAVGGKDVVYLDTPGIGDIDVPFDKLLAKFETALCGENIVDGILVTNQIRDARVRLGAQVVEFLVSKGFVGGPEKWKNVILVGTKLDSVEEGDVECFKTDVVSEMFQGAPNKTGTHVMVHKGDYSELLAAIPKLPNVAIKYEAPSDEQIVDELLPRMAGGESLKKLAEDTRKARAAAQLQINLMKKQMEEQERAFELKRKEDELAAKRREARIKEEVEARAEKIRREAEEREREAKAIAVKAKADADARELRALERERARDKAFEEKEKRAAAERERERERDRERKAFEEKEKRAAAEREHERERERERERQEQRERERRRMLEYEMPFEFIGGRGGGGGLGNTVSTGVACKNCSAGKGCRYAGASPPRPGHY